MKTPTGTLHNGLNIQPLAYREQGETEKALVTYDESLRLLREAGYERHLRPAEAFTLLVEGLEGRLTAEQNKVHDDMLASSGEWLSLAWKRVDDDLITYCDPEGLVWNENRYFKRFDFNSTETKVFNVKGMKSGQYLDLKECNPELVQYLYGRQFSDLPPQMKTGSDRGQLYLSAEGIVRPVGRCGFDGGFYVGSSFGSRSARGVAVVGEKK